MTAVAAAAVKEQFTYDEVPYASFPYAHTHPDQMAVLASLFRMEHPRPETARVLELGCAGGGNIIPLALRYPQAKFTGIDLSPKQIATANEMKKALGLENISFEAQDIMAFDLKKHKGAFDYIICHGVYSWVPEQVSNRILELCRECLSDNGFAFISYNTLPGWNAVRSIAEMMRFHSNRFKNPKEKILEARKLLNFLSETAPEGSSLKTIIEEEKEHLAGANDSYLFHDHLENTNRQFYLHEFAADLKKHGLDYVGDSSIASMFVENLNPKAMATLKVLNDAVLQEQYMDFVLNRRFRCSIVCKQGRTINRSMQADQILKFSLTAKMKPEVENPDFTKPVRFLNRSGKGSFTSNNPLPGALFHEIVKSGTRRLPAEEAISRAARVTGAPAEKLRAALVENGLQLVLRGFLMLHYSSLDYAEKISTRPVAYKLARLQASKPRCTHVTNMLCQSVPIKGIAEKVIPLLDGTRTMDDIRELLVQEALGGKIAVREGNTVLKDKPQISAKLEEAVSGIMNQLLQMALLSA